MIPSRTSGFGPLLLVAAAALPLAACGGQEEETVYEADATDLSGGELIVTDENTPAVPVDLPDTPMTGVPPETPEAGQVTPAP